MQKIELYKEVKINMSSNIKFNDSIINNSNKYVKIHNINDLYFAFLNVWSKETCAPRMRDKWDENNRTCGQCSITSFLVQDIFGGKVYGIPLGDGNFHCFNVVNGYSFDLTSEQFETKLDYANCVEQFRSVHFSKLEKYERYKLLCNNLDKYLLKI